jgi:predicted permease
METLFKDLRYAFRGLVKHRGFTAVAVLTLALGIGANTAIFSVVNAVLFKPLQFHNPEQLAIVWEEASFAGFPRNTPAPANYVDWKTQGKSFADMAAINDRSFNLTGDTEPERVNANGATANFFPLLGIQPLIGRAFTTEDDQAGAHKVVILSYPLWQSRYSGNRGILDTDIQLNGEKYTVIGVMPAGFQFLNDKIRLWVPMAFTPEELAARGSHYLTVVARMKPEVKLAQAQAEMDAMMQRIAKDHPNEMFNGKLGAIVVPLHEQVAGDVRRPLLVLLVAVSFVLLIACGNIASLLLARAAGRQREIAVRTALGASRLRIVRQLLTESVLLASFGGLLGVALAAWSFGFLKKLIPEGLSLSANLALDGRILFFAVVISVFTGILFGLMPALQTARVDLNEALKQGGGRAASSLGRSHVRSLTVLFEVALSLVLLIGAGLLIQTLFQLFNQYSALQPEKVLTLRTELPLTKYKEPAKRAAFYEQVLERVQRLPGVVSAGYTTSVPLLWKGGSSGFYPEGTTDATPGLSYDATHRQVSSKYLQTMNVPLKQGRYFDEHDSENSQFVAIINETMARQYWPGQNVIGRRFKIGDPDEDVPWFSIVGVAGDVRQMGLDAPVKAEMYLPIRQMTTQPWFSPRDLAVRTLGDPLSIVAAARQAVHEVDPDQPISNIATMDDVLGDEASQRRMGMILLSGFAVLAVILASLGIYGVLAYFVTQHRNEIGVRLALGATPNRILFHVLSKGIKLTGLGVIIGLVASFALTRLMTSLLFGVKPADPMTFVAVPCLLGLVAMLACWIPARRAAKTDPMVALRYE